MLNFVLDAGEANITSALSNGLVGDEGKRVNKQMRYSVLRIQGTLRAQRRAHHLEMGSQG